MSAGDVLIGGISGSLTVYSLTGNAVAGIFTGILVATMTNTKWRVLESEIPVTTAYNIGTLLLQDYVVVFELLGILLLVALIGAASMARR